MRQKTFTLITVPVVLAMLCLLANSALAGSKKGKIEHGKKWAAEDKKLDKMLKKLRKKHGTPPNIIHIMWDDTGVGEVGIPQIQKMRGWETPNVRRASSSHACIPSRVAHRAGLRS